MTDETPTLPPDGAQIAKLPGIEWSAKAALYRAAQDCPLDRPDRVVGLALFMDKGADGGVPSLYLTGETGPLLYLLEVARDYLMQAGAPTAVADGDDDGRGGAA